MSFDDPAARGTFINAGYNQRQADFATTMLAHSHLVAPDDEELDGANQWCETFLPPEWVCRLLANHVTDVETGSRLYERAQEQPGLTFQLDLRADALGANCRDLLIESSALRLRAAAHHTEQKAETHSPHRL